MEEKIIYGVDTSKEVTPIMVRDAIIKCFVLAHKEILEMMKEYYKFGSKEEFKEMKELEVELLIKKYFKDTGGNFDNPTKEEIMKVLGKLAEYAKNFRNPEIIEKHYGEIMQLIGKLK